MKPRSLARWFGRVIAPSPRARSPADRLVAALGTNGVTVVLDIGANTGQTGEALRAAGYGGRIVSFEPAAAAHRKLRTSAENDPDWLVPAPVAIGAGDGEATLNVAEETSLSSIRAPEPALLAALRRGRTVARESVPLRRLDGVFDTYVAADDVAFAKIDTQGFEKEVLDGASGAMDRLRGIKIELSLVRLYAGERLWMEHLGRLADLGFDPWLIEPGAYRRRFHRQLQFDVVLFRP